MQEVFLRSRHVLKWKETYETFGLDGLESHYIRMEPGVEKHMKENEKLKHKLQRRS